MQSIPGFMTLPRLVTLPHITLPDLLTLQDFYLILERITFEKVISRHTYLCVKG